MISIATMGKFWPQFETSTAVVQDTGGGGGYTSFIQEKKKPVVIIDSVREEKNEITIIVTGVDHD